MANRYANLPGAAKIKDTYDRINQGFDLVEQDVDQLRADLNQEIADREAAVEYVDQRVDNIIVGGGPDKDPELVDIRNLDPSYTPQREINVAGDVTRDMQAQFMTHKAYIAKQVSPVFNVVGYGGDPTGVTDSTMSIQAAIEDARQSGGGKVLFPDGIFKVSSTLRLYDNIAIDLSPGSIIDASGMPTGGVLFRATGNLSNQVSITTSLNERDTEITVPVGVESQFSPGDIIFIKSEDQWAENAKQGEFHFVVSVAPGKIVLEDGLWDSYATAITIEKMNPVQNITITGGRIVGGGEGDLHYATLFQYCKDVTIQNVIFEDFERQSIGVNSCIVVHIANNKFYRSNHPATGYGVAMYAGDQWVNIIGNTFIDCRHGVTAGGGYGINRFVNIIGNHCYGGQDAGIDSHVPGQYFNIIGNTITVDPNGSPGDGIVFEGAECIISNNTIIGTARRGINYSSTKVKGTTGVTINGNTLRNIGGPGIIVNPIGDGCSIRNLSICNNILDEIDSNAIYIYTSSGPNNGITDFKIDNNIMTNIELRGIYVRAASAPISWGTISGNRITHRTDSQNSIEIWAEGQTVERILLTNNVTNGGYRALRGINQTKCYATGNIFLGTNPITGFTPEELGDNITS